MNSVWNKSTYSNAGSECVECRTGNDTVSVRDTQHRTLTTLAFPTDAWRDFVAGVKDDEL